MKKQQNALFQKQSQWKNNYNHTQYWTLQKGEIKITLWRVPWYLFPGFPNPTINQGVNSTLTPLGSGSEADTLSLVGAKGFW